MEQRLDRILEYLEQLLPNDVADILLVRQGIVRTVHWRGYEKFGLDQSIESVTYNLTDTTNLRLVKETGRPLAIPNVEQYADWVARPGLDWIKSQASAPIRIGNHIVGFLNINSTQPGVYTQHEAEQLQLFADRPPPRWKILACVSRPSALPWSAEKPSKRCKRPCC
jgi:GAF domain-containing protein